MNIEEKPKQKIAEIWLTKSENNFDSTQSILNDLYEEYGRRKYKVVVFISGNENLYSATETLILQNRK